MTKIILIQPNGYEVWFIKDFDKGSGISKWYRGYAYTVNAAVRIAKLNAMGIETQASDKTSENISWFRFAEDSMKHSPKGIVCHSSLPTYSLTVSLLQTIILILEGMGNHNTLGH